MGLSQLNFEGKNKIDVAIERIQYFEPPEGYQLAFSGGKDSMVIYELAKESEVAFRAFYNWTGIDPPELLHFVRQQYTDIEVRRPQKSIWKLIESHHMLPTRSVRFCCEGLKENSTEPGMLITGVRWQESPRRRKRSMAEVSYRRSNVKFLHPIIDWTEKDVWDYISLRELPYCELYDQGYRRLGCILCPFIKGESLQRDMNRYPKHVAMWRRAANRLWDAGYSRLRFSSGDELFEWWLTRERIVKIDENQCSFFGEG